MGSTLSSYHPLQARPERSGKIYPLKDHLSDVKSKAASIIAQSEIYSETFFSDIANHDIYTTLNSVISVSHDIGKASRYFQNYIAPNGINSGKKKAHSPLSAVYAFYATKKLLGCCKDVEKLSTFSTMCVLAHHGHLESPIKSSQLLRSMASTIAEQINSIDAAHLSELDTICESLGMPLFSIFKTQYQDELQNFKRIQGVTSYDIKDLSQFYAVANLFSALIDADRLSAAELELPQRASLPVNRMKQNIVSMQLQAGSNTDPNIVKMRQAIFDHITNQVERISLDKRIFSLTAPTGSGKTISGLYFALRFKERSRIRGLEPRIIYVAPFLSIIDQNFEVFKTAVGEDSERSDIILAHHHLCEMNYRTEDFEYSTDKSPLLVEGWHSEIIVTTLVQFAYTILGRGSAELRKLHNIAGSIIILDEVQSIPTDYWELVRQSFLYLSSRFGVTFILMTATQPLIFDHEEVIEILEGFEFPSLPEQCQLDTSYLQSSDQSKVRTLAEYATLVIESLDKTESNIMIIMNTINSACFLFDELNGKLRHHDLFYLSAEVVPKQRKEIITTIKSRMEVSREKLPPSRPIFLVTTQLIEAGVDIDFDMVFRDLAPMDSIIQSAGRCNRRGLRPRSESKTIVLELVDETGKSFARRVYDEVSIQKTKDILAYFSNRTFKELADLYYNKMKELRNKSMETKIINGIRSLNYDCLDDFELIEDTPGGSVFVEIDDEAVKLYERFVEIWNKKNSERGESSREFLKIRSKFYGYVVNIPERYLSHLGDKSHGIYHVAFKDRKEMYNEKGFVRNYIGLI